MLGDRIKEIRDAHGLTQEDLATAIGVSRTTITKYERNERVPDLITLTKITEILGISLDYVCGRKPSVKEKAAHEIIAMFDKKGLSPNDIESNEFRRLLAVVNFVLDTYCRR
jgi:putative transcriptional regulator